ncbi:MAG: CPBP family intramembrane metalloprotease [Ruminococcaceae bacterium]|nr:CPBP family intramembrane metalloprotease [Oscillospiraceae bacterium]
MKFHQSDSHKNDAIYVSEAVGCVLLCAMLLFLLTAAFFGQEPSVSVQTLIFKIGGKFLVFVLPALWGVWMLRRSGISFPREFGRNSLHKDQTVILSSFGLIVIIQMLYTAVFPAVKTTANIALAETPAQIFLLFLSVSLIPAVAEEVLFRGFLMRSLGLFRRSLAVLMSALTFALMHFSVTGFPLFFACGLILAMSYLSTGSLSVSVGVHFLCNAFWFLAETVETYLPQYAADVMRGAFVVCVLLCVSGIPFLKENMRVFFEDEDEPSFPSSQFWTLPTVLFVLTAAAIQIWFQ